MGVEPGKLSQLNKFDLNPDVFARSFAKLKRIGFFVDMPVDRLDNGLLLFAAQFAVERWIEELRDMKQSKRSRLSPDNPLSCLRAATEQWALKMQR